MTQSTPNADVEARSTSSGYSLSSDGNSALWGAVEFGGNAFNASLDGADHAIDGDQVFALVDTTSSTATATIDTDAVKEGHVIVVVDKGGLAGVNNITIATEGSETIDGSATASIATNSSSTRLVSDGSDWFTW